MQLIDLYEIWDITHKDKNFFEGMGINPDVDVDILEQYIFTTYGNLHVVDEHPEMFHFMVKTFFNVHKFNIDELCKTMNYEYEPLDNYRFKQKLGRMTDDTKRYDKTDTADRGKSSSTVEHQQTDREYSESGSQSGTDANLVSAFNDVPSPTGGSGTSDAWHYVDTEHHRDVESQTYRRNGNDDTTMEDGIEYAEEEGEKRVTDYDEAGHEDVIEGIERTGTANVSFQSLIKEQRDIAEFNIYKWIGRHFANELLVGIW